MCRTYRHVIAVILGGVLVDKTCLADASEDRIPRSAMFASAIECQNPNQQLPIYVSAPDGEMTVFADHAHTDKWVPIYLVNRTRGPLNFPMQDSDLGFKLEVQDSNGQWVRAQAHSYSWCGNSYYSHSLPAGQHWVVRGYQPATGKRSLIRFALHGRQELISNPGEGLFTELDVVDATKDDLAGDAVPFSSARGLINGDSAKASLREQVAALRLLAGWEQNGYIRTMSEIFLTRVRKDSSAEAALAVDAIQEILAAKWPDYGDPDNFIESSLRQLTEVKQPHSHLPFGALIEYPSVIWGGLLDMARATTSDRIGRTSRVKLRLKAWKPVADLACTSMRTGANPTPRLLLGIPAIADEFVADAFFESNLGSGDVYIRTLAAEALARRARWSKLVELGSRLPGDKRSEVLRYLAGYPANGESGAWRPRIPPDEGDELKFWVECFQLNPLGSAEALHMADNFGSSTRSPYPRELHDALRVFLEQEASKGTKAQADFPIPAGRWGVAVQLLASWRDESDVPMLRQLSQHRGYIEDTVYTSSGNKMNKILRRTYALRKAAVDALATFRKAEPDDIIVVQDIPAK